MWIRIDNQDVGSEAATIERVRNSSLVKWICAENSAGLKLGTEAADQVTGSPTNFGPIPAGTRAVQLPDNGFNSYFLTVFGRPESSSACECERFHESFNEHSTADQFPGMDRVGLRRIRALKGDM